jgi:hypothetical protein
MLLVENAPFLFNQLEARLADLSGLLPPNFQESFYAGRLCSASDAVEGRQRCRHALTLNEFKSPNREPRDRRLGRAKAEPGCCYLNLSVGICRQDI